MIRQLIPGIDDILFSDALHCYLTTTDHVKSGYTLNARMEFVDIHIKLFSEVPSDNYLVIAEIDNNVVIGLAIGFVNDLIIDRVNKHILPGWHLAFTWRKQHHWNSPKSFIFDITNPISTHMESCGIFDFTKVLRVSSNIIKLGIEKYVEKVILRNLPDSRYEAFIEAIVDVDSDLEKLPYLYKKILPETIITPKIIIRHSLRNILRQGYLLKNYG